MGLLNTIETLLSVMENQPQIMARLQPTVLQVVAHIFGESVMGKSNNNSNGNKNILNRYITLDYKCILFINIITNIDNNKSFVF